MKYIPILGLALFAASAASAQTTIFDHTFDGSAATPLNGTAEDYSGVLWTVGGGTAPEIYANGVATDRGGAVLAYAFTTGVYEVTSQYTAGASVAGITFTTSDPAVGDWVSGGVDLWGTFALRSSGDFEFWEGSANLNGNDGGNLVSDYGGTLADPLVGTFRLVLDWNDTAYTGTIAGYFTPNGGSEFQVDLDAGSASMTNTISPGADLTGVGLTFDGDSGENSYQTFGMTSIPEPSSYALLGGLLALGLVAFRRRR